MTSPTGPQGPSRPHLPSGYGPPPNQAPPLPPTRPPQQLSDPPEPPQPEDYEARPQQASSGQRQIDKGLLGSLLDVNFDYLVTPKMIKLFYGLGLGVISAFAVLMVAFGLWVFQYGWVLGLLVLIFAPVFWIFELLLVRIFLEAVIARFKSVEYLRVIKDRL